MLDYMLLYAGPELKRETDHTSLQYQIRSNCLQILKDLSIASSLF